MMLASQLDCTFLANSIANYLQDKLTASGLLECAIVKTATENIFAKYTVVTDIKGVRHSQSWNVDLTTIGNNLDDVYNYLNALADKMTVWVKEQLDAQP